MKRYISLILAAILCCLALTSCGGSSEKDDDNSTIDNTASNETTSGTTNSQTGTNPTHEILDPYTLYRNQLLLDGGPQLTTLQAPSIPEELYQYCLQSGGSSDEASTLNFDEEKALSQIENELSAAYGNKIYKIKSITQTLISLPNSQFAYKYKVYTMYTDSNSNELYQAWGSHGFEFLIIAE